MGPGDIWDQIWSLGGLPMPPKGTFWAKTGPFGAPGGPEEAQYKAKVCGYHEFDQTVAVGTKSGTPGPSEDLRGPQKGILRPKQALTGRKALGARLGARFGPNCRRLVRMGWSHGYHTLWPGIGPLLGPQGPQKGPFWP